MIPSPLGHIGRYELLSRLAAGGMGEVFLARATGAGGFEKRLVIKRILPHLADDPEFVRRFIAEGKLVVRLRHAGIAQVLDMGEEEGVTFIAMEHVDGRDLGELTRLAKSGGVEMPAPLIVTIIVRLLEALDYAHTATDDDGAPLGIIHRDISPSNVMISKTGEVKLLDFGIARATERLQATTTGAIRGKYSYMSPQQAAGATLDARSDLFSVGVLMWELLVGSRPFDGESDLLTLDRIRFHQPGSLSAAAPDVPAPIAAVVDRLLEKDPDDRFPTAEAAMRALMAWLNEVGAVVVPRDLSAWLERVLATMPEGLRRLPSTGMSLDDLLVMGLGSEGERPGPSTDPAGERAPYTRTVSAPGTRPVSRPGGTPVGTYTPAPVSPSRVALRPTTTPSEPGTATPFPTDPAAQVVGEPPTRGRRSVFALLVALNVLLLAAVAWLVVRASEDDNGSVAPENAVADVVSAPDTAVAVVTQPDEPDTITVAEEPDTVTVVAAADTVEPMDAAPELVSGSAFGSLVSELGERLAPELVSLKVTTTPPGARVTLAGLGAGVSPFTMPPLRPGTPISGRVTHDGYHPKPFRAVVGEDESVHVALKARTYGNVIFRPRPANASISIDGQRVNPNTQGLVRQRLEVGEHTLKIVAGERTLRRRFEVKEGAEANLKTLDAEKDGKAP